MPGTRWVLYFKPTYTLGVCTVSWIRAFSREPRALHFVYHYFATYRCLSSVEGRIEQAWREGLTACTQVKELLFIESSQRSLNNYSPGSQLGARWMKFLDKIPHPKVNWLPSSCAGLQIQTALFTASCIQDRLFRDSSINQHYCPIF